MREKKRVTITAKGRDFGKIFVINEMPADQGERWASRAILAIANAGGRMPEGVIDGGLAGLEVSWQSLMLVGMQAFAGLKWDEVEPLLAEMKPCIQWIPSANGKEVPGAPAQDILPGEESQVEEIKTWYTLRLAWIELHLGFSVADVTSTSGTDSPDNVTPAS